MDEEQFREDLEFIPLYRLTNNVEAIFLKEVFDTEDIPNVFQNLKMQAFPTDVGDQAEIVILVNESDYDRAKNLILSAIASSAITSEGVFATPES